MKLLPLLLFLCVFIAATTAKALDDLLASNTAITRKSVMEVLAQESGMELSQLMQGERQSRNSEFFVCAPHTFKYCDMITYPVFDHGYLDMYDELLFNASTYNASNPCSAATKNFLCAMSFSRCTEEEMILPICSSVCIDFSSRCASFYSSTFCLDDTVYAQGNTGCTELLVSNPPLSCSVPTNLNTCSGVQYTTPTTLSGGTNAEPLVDFYMTFIQPFINIMRNQRGWTQATADHCKNTFVDFYCRYVFFECVGGDPYTIVPPCGYDCEKLENACPGFYAESGIGTDTCLPFIGNLTCTVVDGVVSWSWAWGDPHLTTLDGYEYEFNGAGEFWLSVSDDSSLQLQARFEPCGLGTCTTALAFCLGDNCATKFMITATSATTLSVLQNGQDATLPSLVGVDGVAVDPNDPSTLTISLGGKKGFVKVSPSAGNTLLFLSGFKSSLHNKVNGLLGHFSGVITDDLTAKDGTVLELEGITQTLIFNNFGLSWRVAKEESLFTYVADKTYESVNNLTYVPVFSDDTGFEFSTDAETACEGQGLTGKFLAACKFDVTVTLNTEFAEASTRVQSLTRALPSSIDYQLEQINPSPTPSPSPSSSSFSSTTSEPSTTSNASSLQWGVAAIVVVASLLV